MLPPWLQELALHAHRFYVGPGRELKLQSMARMPVSVPTVRLLLRSLCGHLPCDIHGEIIVASTFDRTRIDYIVSCIDSFPGNFRRCVSKEAAWGFLNYFASSGPVSLVKYLVDKFGFADTCSVLLLIEPESETGEAKTTHVVRASKSKKLFDADCFVCDNLTVAEFLVDRLGVNAVICSNQG